MKGNYTPLFLALTAATFFLPFLGGVHLFDWDEINFAEISREMMMTGEYTQVTVNFIPFWEKPPLFFWTQVLSMRLFGVGEYSARFPNAVCGMITLVLLYDIGRKIRSHRFGILWAICYFGSVLPYLYFKSGIIDPVFNLFVFLGLYFFILGCWKQDPKMDIPLKRSHWTYFLMAGVFVGLGMLAKGQVAYLIPVLVIGVYWFWGRLRMFVSIPQFFLFTLVAILIMLSWYGAETLKNGPAFVVEFTKYQYSLFSAPSAGHSGFPGYHFVVILVGCFPASVFFVRSLYHTPTDEKAHQLDFARWMRILFWVVLILFTVVRSKIVHYSSLCYFPLTFLAAYIVEQILQGKISFGGWLKWGLWGIGGVYILACLLIPFAGMHPGRLAPLFDDAFAHENLKATVRWTGFEVLPGLWMLAVIAFSIRQFNRQQPMSAFYSLFAGVGIFVFAALIAYVGRIEAYSQRAAIEFYESLQDEDCYVDTWGFRSYAQYFYSDKQPPSNAHHADKKWLLTGDIDKTAYMVVRIPKDTAFQLEFPHFAEVYRKNGFVFYRRQPG